MVIPIYNLGDILINLEEFNMAYLTESSYRQLIERVEIKNVERIDRQFFTTNIFYNEYLFYFFNQFELKRLFKEKRCCKIS